MNFIKIREELINLVLKYTPKLIMSILIIFIGFALVKFLLRLLDKFMNKSRVDRSVHSFVISVSEALLRIIVLITAASALGIPTATFVAVFGTVGLAVGLAVKDSLSNFAGGVLILSFRPFNVGDFIEAGGKTGTVKEIKILYTHINTPDNKRIVIPNGDLANTQITNYSTESERRVDLIFQISYKDNIDNARKILNEILVMNDLVLKSPKPSVKVDSLENNSVNLIVKAWTHKDNYLEVYYDVQESVKKRFDSEKINMSSS